MISAFDPNKRGFISFANLRRIFTDIHLSLKESYIEYLIYKMKKFESLENKLEELKYEVCLCLFVYFPNFHSLKLFSLGYF